MPMIVIGGPCSFIKVPKYGVSDSAQLKSKKWDLSIFLRFEKRTIGEETKRMTKMPITNRKSLLMMKRHQLVYKAIWDEMQSGAIHAVDSIDAKTPAEAGL